MPIITWSPGDTDWVDDIGKKVWDPAASAWVTYVMGWVWNPSTLQWEAFIQQEVEKLWGDGVIVTKSTVRLDFEAYSRSKSISVSDLWTLGIQSREVPPKAVYDAATVSKTTTRFDFEDYSRSKTLTLSGVWTKSIHSYNGPSAPPSGLNATDNSSCTFGNPTPNYTAHLTWTNGDSSAQTEIWYAGSYYDIVGAGVSQYDAPAAVGNNDYKVRHKKDGIYSAFSLDSVTVSALSCAPSGPPTAISATDASTCASCTPTYKVQVSVTLADTSAYTRIYRGAALVQTLNPGVSLWQYDTGVTAQAYTYEARHYKNGVETSTGNPTDGVTVVNPCTVPATPSNLRANAISATVIDIDLAGPAGAGVDYITVYESGTSTVVGTLNAANGWAIQDTGLNDNTLYCYECVAHHGTSGCSSAQGGEACDTTWPLVPTNFIINHVSDTRNDLTWSVGTRTGTAMEIQVQDSGGWTVANYPTAGTEAWNDLFADTDDIAYRIRFQGETSWNTKFIQY